MQIPTYLIAELDVMNENIIECFGFTTMVQMIMAQWNESKAYHLNYAIQNYQAIYLSGTNYNQDLNIFIVSFCMKTMQSDSMTLPD